MNHLLEKERTTPLTLSVYPSTISKLNELKEQTGLGWSVLVRELIDQEHARLPEKVSNVQNVS